MFECSRVVFWGRCSLVVAALALAPAGCMVASNVPADDGTSPAVGDDVGVQQEALFKTMTGATSRTDVTSTITLPAGTTGTFSAFRYCPPGTFAVGYHQQVQSSLSIGDDTGLNAIELECMDPQGNVFGAQAQVGGAGTWSPGAICPRGLPVRGAALRLQPSGGIPDPGQAGCRRTCNENVGFLDSRMTCADGSQIQAKGGWTITGANYTADALCPAQTSVCGISVKAGAGNTDKTGMGGVKLACCPYPYAPYAVQVTERTMDGIHARTFVKNPSPETTPLIIVEGFDIDGEYTVDALAMLVGIQTERKDLLGRLLSLNYSVTFVDLTKNSETIQANARRVGALANQLWLESSRIRPVKLIGASMGGLIVTTAAAMKDGWSAIGETNPGWSFPVDHVTTMDTPHGGAYIPQAIYHLCSRFQGHRAAAKALLGKLTSPAAKQMLYIPYDASFEEAHNTWQAYYDRVLNYMRKADIRFVSVVNGAWNNTPLDAGWMSGVENVHFSDDGYTTDAFAWLYTQPASPGGLVARIKTSGVGLTDEDKRYYTYGTYPVVENLPGGFATHWQRLADELKPNSTGPKWPKSSFVPTWSAAGIPFGVWRSLPTDQQTDLGRLESVRGRLAGSALSPFDRILHTNVNNEHPFVPQALAAAFIDELSLARVIPGDTAVWTGWLNRDDPSGNGDGEHFSLFAGMPCKAPLTAECRRASDGVDWSRTGEIMRCSAAGAECLNANQPDGTCDDYEVRFACPNPSIVGPWLDRDDPTGNGDGEHLGLLVSEYGVCAEPIGIECQTTGGVDVGASGEVVRCQANLGLECINANQSDQSCQDYQVRFACPASTWGGWTGWDNVDDTDGDGDGEKLADHAAEGYTCARPLAAECRRRSDHLDWKLVGQTMICTAAEGSVCRNDQNGGGCDDYEVRFFCPDTWKLP